MSEDEKYFSCGCNWYFTTKKTLAEHSKRYCGDTVELLESTKHVCGHCTGWFNTKELLYKHMDKLHTCGCGKDYSSRSSLARHIKKCNWLASDC